MRRVALACAIVIGLAIGSGVRTSAIGLTQVTLKCNDGTNVPLVVDTDTLTGLTQGIQAMIDYPAGLTCTLVQNPLGAFFGGVALASPGQSPFIVGGGRWDVPCEVVSPPPGCDPFDPDCCPPNCGGAIEPPALARAPGSWLALAAAQQSELNRFGKHRRELPPTRRRVVLRDSERNDPREPVLWGHARRGDPLHLEAGGVADRMLRRRSG